MPPGRPQPTLWNQLCRFHATAARSSVQSGTSVSAMIAQRMERDDTHGVAPRHPLACVGGAVTLTGAGRIKGNLAA
jgi:hypothetical protein